MSDLIYVPGATPDEHNASLRIQVIDTTDGGAQLFLDNAETDESVAFMRLTPATLAQFRRALGGSR